ncbi:hypothetical protein FB45DRAFT_1035424 [Roridomyces roridus]|uniref:Uncharacterized protein n=1 Tax=Roridomyces roridus TaxID=1738132 RepID=A0AAD7BA96_9AGAR|nr:hypothetical protein FB45DRAFT_1035424 [Roridomyces roridus]
MPMPQYGQADQLRVARVDGVRMPPAPWDSVPSANGGSGCVFGLPLDAWQASHSSGHWLHEERFMGDLADKTSNRRRSRSDRALKKDIRPVSRARRLDSTSLWELHCWQFQEVDSGQQRAHGRSEFPLKVCPPSCLAHYIRGDTQDAAVVSSNQSNEALGVGRMKSMRGSGTSLAEWKAPTRADGRRYRIMSSFSSRHRGREDSDSSSWRRRYRQVAQAVAVLSPSSRPFLHACDATAMTQERAPQPAGAAQAAQQSAAAPPALQPLPSLASSTSASRGRLPAVSAVAVPVTAAFHAGASRPCTHGAQRIAYISASSGPHGINDVSASSRRALYNVRVGESRKALARSCAANVPSSAMSARRAKMARRAKILMLSSTA